jgi:predicted ribosome quality control (RQC) complex YloA/Tae2 family protein
LKTRRLTQVKQLGVDRILQLTFSDGLYHLFLEFFAGGNVILTDAELNQLAVLRIVPPGEDGSGECRAGARYDATGKPRPGAVTRERVLAALEKAIAADAEVQAADAVKAAGGKKYQKKKKKGDSALKRVLGARLSEFSPVLIEHALLGVGVDPGVKAEEVVGNEELLGKVLEAFKEAEGIVEELTEAEGVQRGYIIAKQPKDTAAPQEKGGEKKKSVAFGSVEAVERDVAEEVQAEGEAKGLVFDDFHPFLPRQFVGIPGLKTLEFEGFNKTVDTFFSSIESQKLESRLREREAAATKRLEAARTDHLKRVEALRDVQDINVRKAQTLEANSYRVEEAIAAVNSLLSQSMDWVAVGRLIESEQRRGNAVAEIIQMPLKLYENTITLKLWEAGEDQDDDDGDFDGFTDDGVTDEEKEEDEISASTKPLTIDVDLSLSAYANSRSYYDQKRNAADKETKTLQSSAKALKSTEKKVAADLKKGLKNEKQLMRPVRKTLWFEKFMFFISSDGYLVLGGRDAQQNEHIYKRHFKRGDVYVHADIRGAASIIVKNNPSTPNAPIPPSTLQQAGSLSVCTSQAWDSKAVLSAWWVHFDQVSKTAPTGEYLGTGSFMVRGRKNFLPPAQLILGYGVLWKVDEESKKKHVRHRVEQEKEDEEEKAAEKAFAEEDAKAKGKIEEAHDEAEDKEDSEDEGFPDAKPESDDEDAFPDAKMDSESANEDTESDFGYEEEGTRAEEASDRYGLIASNAAALEEPIAPILTAVASSDPGPRHLSAKQRRDLKKGKPIIASIPVFSQEPSRSSTPNTAASKSAPLPRGKRAKAKRAAHRYAHQDEEDRELALSLLGANISPSTASDPTTAEGKKETPEERNARLREQHRRAQAAGLEEEARRHGGDEGADDQEEEHEIATTPLDAFVPDPYDDDVLLDAIPVCAPWGAMGRFKYRAKMTPGAQKRGKAVRDVWSGWLAEKSRMKGKEKELVAGWREQEVVACVCVGKVKVLSGGASADKGKGKAAGGKGGKAGRGKGNKRK